MNVEEECEEVAKSVFLKNIYKHLPCAGIALVVLHVWFLSVIRTAFLKRILLSIIYRWGSRDPEGQLCQDSIEEPGFEYSSSDCEFSVLSIMIIFIVVD